MLMRHAKSAWDDPELSDHDRPLNGRGRDAAERMGRYMVEQGLEPQLVLCSSAVRTSETLEILSRSFTHEPQVHHHRGLYLASPATILQAIRRWAEKEARILLLGHNPGMHELVEHFTEPLDKFPTAALAEISFDLADWQSLIEASRPRCWRVVTPKSLADGA